MGQKGVEEHTLAVSAANPPPPARPGTLAPAARPDTSTARSAAMKPCRTATTSITWSTDTCTILVTGIATIMAWCRRREPLSFRRGPLSGSEGDSLSLQSFRSAAGWCGRLLKPLISF
jgi:hypothetical protein